MGLSATLGGIVRQQLKGRDLRKMPDFTSDHSKSPKRTKNRRCRTTFGVILSLLSMIASLLVLAPGTSLATPSCASADSDSDGDGWGWENNASCRVVEAPAPSANASAASNCVDSDGDGWGWDGTSTCRPSEPVGNEAAEEFSFFAVSIAQSNSSGITTLSWPSAGTGTTYTVYRFFADGDEIRSAQAQTQSTSRSYSDPSNLFYMVLVEDRGNAVAGSGLYTSDGQCVDLCSQKDWEAFDNDANRQIAAVPVAVIAAQVVGRVVVAALRWCQRNSIQCGTIGDGLQIADGLLERLNPDEPAGERGIERAVDFLDDGFEPVDEDSVRVVLENDNGDRVVISANDSETLVTVVLEVGPDGRPLSLTETTETVTRASFGGLDIRETEVRTQWHYENDVITGSFTDTSIDGVHQSTSCNGQSGHSSCADRDSDGILDRNDLDIDGDGILNENDPEPTVPYVPFHQTGGDDGGGPDPDDPRTTNDPFGTDQTCGSCP